MFWKVEVIIIKHYLLINAPLYPYKVDSIKQTYKHGYIYIYTYTNMTRHINHTLKQT